jgi:hypothetical protein
MKRLLGRPKLRWEVYIQGVLKILLENKLDLTEMVIKWCTF